MALSSSQQLSSESSIQSPSIDSNAPTALSSSQQPSSESSIESPSIDNNAPTASVSSPFRVPVDEWLVDSDRIKEALSPYASLFNEMATQRKTTTDSRSSTRLKVQIGTDPKQFHRRGSPSISTDAGPSCPKGSCELYAEAIKAYRKRSQQLNVDVSELSEGMGSMHLSAETRLQSEQRNCKIEGMKVLENNLLKLTRVLNKKKRIMANPKRTKSEEFYCRDMSGIQTMIETILYLVDNYTMSMDPFLKECLKALD